MNQLPELSPGQQEWLFREKKRKKKLRLCQIGLLVLFFGLWELLARVGVIDGFLMSQPSRMLHTILAASQNNLLHHIGVTCYETLTGFALGILIGCTLSTLLWWSPFACDMLEPYLVVLNALPKIALGPVIILWAGAGTRAIIVMTLFISTVVTVLEMLNGFLATDPNMIKMARSFGASRWQTFFKLVLPANLRTLFSSLKINIGLSMVGVIAGEFLVSRAGLGYLIVYGGQVFQMDLVMSSVLILAVLAAVLYKGVSLIEKLLSRVYHIS